MGPWRSALTAPVQPRPDPRCRLILPDPEHTAGRLDLGPLASVASAKWIEIASFRTPRVPAGVRAQPSAPQFASSQSVTWEYRCPRPPGRTLILMRTGKRRSAAVMISRGLPGISRSLFVLREANCHAPGRPVQRLGRAFG